MPTLIKLSDERFNGNHPNGINPGSTKKIETMPEIPIVGECYWFGSRRTSIVTEILYLTDSEYKFKTLNSTYLVKLF
jgi:hypothetical protein